MTDLPQTMRALVLHEAGGGLILEEVPRPVPKPGEVLVRVAASPINPSDLAMLEGEYGLGWPYPLIPGLEGAGQVAAVGAGFLAGRLRGKRVAMAAAKQGLWAEYAVVPATQCVPLPDGLSFGVGASSFVNPLTAIALVAEVRGARQTCAVSTAAGGALGAMIRKRAAQKGVTIINVVRKAAQVEALKAEGAEHVLNETAPDFDEALKALCKELRCRMAFDAVGGAMTFRLAEALRGQGRIEIYGGLSGKAATVHPGTMIFKGLQVRGFWLSKWLAQKNVAQMILLSRDVTRNLGGGFAETRVARVARLEEAVDAPGLYAADMSAGKTLISTGAFDLGL